MAPDKKMCEYCSYNGSLDYVSTDDTVDPNEDYKVYIYICPECNEEQAGQKI